MNNFKKWLVVFLVPIVVGLLHYLSDVLRSQGNLVETGFLVLGMFGGFGLLLADIEWLYKYYIDPSTDKPEGSGGSGGSVVGESEVSQTLSPPLSPPPPLQAPHQPSEQLSQQPASQPQKKPPEYITRSILFILALFPLAIYMLTSTGSALGIGLLMGILIGLSIEMFFLRQQSAEFQARFLSQVKRAFTPEEIEWFALGFCGFTIIISILAII